MMVRRGMALVSAAAVIAWACPASAQFFMRSKDMAGMPVTGIEPGIAQPMPGATSAELQAGLVWSLRAGLNVAALQCQFEPSLQTVDNYNAVLKDHKEELAKSYDTLTKYFVRTNKAPKAGQSALDTFGTKTYASFGTVAAQYNFCEVANEIGRDAIYQKRGTFAEIAQQRMRELRNSLVPWGEQNFAPARYYTPLGGPRLDQICWTKKGEWVAKKCGVQRYGLVTGAPATIAAR